MTASNTLNEARARLETEASRLQGARLASLFKSDAERARNLTFSAAGLTLDVSKQRIDRPALEGLKVLAQAAEFENWRARLFAGEAVNNTEGRAAKHWALRASDPLPEVRETRARMAAFATRILPEIDAIIHLG